MKRATIATAFVGTTIASAWWLMAGEESNEPESSDVSAAEPCAFEVGQRLAFEVTAQSRYRSNPSVLLGGEPPPPTAPSTKEFEGEMWWRVLEQPAPDSWSVAATLHEPRVTLDDEPLDTSDGRLEHAVLFRMKRDCTVTALASPDSEAAPAFGELQLLLLLAEMQVPDSAQSQWMAEQTDTVGTYRAHYQRTDAGRIGRVRRRYTELGLARPDNAVVELSAAVMHSEAEARVTRSGAWFDRFRAHEHVRIHTPEAVFIDVDTELTVTRVEAPDHGAFWTRAFPTLNTLWRKPAALLPVTNDGGLVLADVGGRSLPEVLGEFSDLLEGAGDPDHQRALSLMVSYLRGHPDHPQALIDRLRDDPSLSERVRSMAFLALELTGGPAAHEALFAAISDPSLQPGDRLRAVVAYRDVRDADDSFVGNLEEVLVSARRSGDRSIESAALLGIGALNEHPGLSQAGKERVAEVLRSELAGAERPDRQIDALGAVGNSKDPEFAETVREFAMADDANVRAAAFDALESIGAPPLGLELADGLLSDASPVVQAELGQQLVAHADALDTDTVVLLADSLSPEVEPVRRAALIEALGKNVDRVPEAKAALWGMLDGETDPQMLKLIGRYLPAIDEG